MNSADIHSHMDIESSFSSSSGSNCSAMVMQFQMGFSKPVCKEMGNNQADGLNYFNNGCDNAVVNDDYQNNLTVTQTSSLMNNQVQISSPEDVEMD